MKGIKNGRLILEDGILEDNILLFDEKIIDIVSKDEYNLSTIELIDAGGNFVSAGFINIHVHGCLGYDVMDEDGLIEISKGLLKTGVTSYLATTITMEFEKIELALKRIRKAMKEQKFAKILGAHLEGPFINKNYKGAHDEKFIKNPDFNIIEPYLDVIKMITVAPELDGAIDFIKKCSDKEIIVSLGHSSATFDEAKMAIKYGAKNITHTFNAMPSLHHRNPGILGAAFTSDIFCEIIADNIHIHPSLYDVILRIKGKDKIILVTDSNMACLLNDGIYKLGGQTIIVKDKKATLKDGTIAGSVLPMNEAIKNFYKNTNLEIYDVVNMATLNPARLLNIDDRKGSIKKGKDAELCIFDDKFNVIEAINA